MNFINEVLKGFLKGGVVLIEQEHYKQLMTKLIHETEDCKIKTAEEMIQKLVNELSSNKVSHSNY